ncbi:MAG TPA: SH3 domain-containing protein [Methylomirabilota bacterium]|nr:SH3 domain-containing protein [Methylomirabilota bacterium]
MGGLGVFIGARLFRGANPRIGRHAQLDVSSPSPFPLPGKNETSQSQERPGAETAKPAGDSGGEAQQTSPGASPLPLSAESATEKASLGPVGFSPPAKASTGSVSAEALPPSLEQSNPLVGLLPPSASPADLLPGRHKIIAKANVPIRDSPTVTAKIIAERGPGQTVLVTKVFGQWVEIRSKKGTAGYIPREVIAVELLPEEKQQSAVPAPKG